VSQAANKYWVGTSGGNFSDNANWSTTSGGANDTTAPGTNDVAYFTSGDVDNAIIDVDSNVNNFYMSSGYSGIITVASGVTLTTDVLFSQADGTFNAGDTVIALNGTTANTISGGTFNLQSADLNINYPLTVSNGIFDGGTGNITFSHAYADLTISGGNFTFPSGTTTIKDAFVISGSAVVQDNNSTIVHNCTSLSSGFCRFTFASSFTVTNFIVNHTDTFPTEIRSPGSLIVSSTLTIIDGRFLTGASYLVEFTGPEAGLTIASTFDGGSGILKISGADTRNYTFDANIKFPGIYLNAANTTFDFSGTASTTIGGVLTIFAGEFYASSTDIIIASNLVQTGGIFDAQNSKLISIAGYLTVSAGTFNAGTNTGTVDVANYVTLSSTETFNLQTATLEVSNTLTVSEGTFDGGSGNITLVNSSADLIISGGTFTFPSGTTIVNDSLNIGASATINENSSTLVAHCTVWGSDYCRWYWSGTLQISKREQSCKRDRGLIRCSA